MDSIFMFDKVARSDAGVPAPRKRRSSLAKKRGLNGRVGAGNLPSADFFLLQGAEDGVRRSGYRKILETGDKKATRPPASPLPRRRKHEPALKTKPKRAASLVSALVSLFRRAAEAGVGALARMRGNTGRTARSAAESARQDGNAAAVAQPARSEARGKLRDHAAFRPLVFGVSAFLILCLIGLTAAFSGPRFPLPEGGLVRDLPSVHDDLLDFVTPELAATVTETSLPPLPKSLATDSYTVTKGDTLGSIAARHGVDIDTLVSMNGITSAKGLAVGQVLKIPNMKGIVHVVTKGESLSSIATANKLSMTAIADANNLGTGVLTPGQAIFLPGVHLASADLRSVFGDQTIWPVKGIISSWFGYRPDPFTGVRRFHGGLDIAIPSGTPVKAAMDGRVADVGYSQEFGNYVIINHAKGLQTLYGHLSKQTVVTGQAIAQGQVLGLSGNTGYSTAPHLHFGIYKGGVSVNPLKYLK